MTGPARTGWLLLLLLWGWLIGYAAYRLLVIGD